MAGLVKKLRPIIILRKLVDEAETQVSITIPYMMKMFDKEKPEDVIRLVNQCQKYHRLGKFDLQQSAFIFSNGDDEIDHKGLMNDLEFNLNLVRSKIFMVIFLAEGPGQEVWWRTWEASTREDVDAQHNFHLRG